MSPPAWLAGIEISNPVRTAYWAINQEKKETYMSKNLTRKGLAFGALVALGASVIAGAPANAAGVDNTATLVPATGYAEAYAVPAAATATFSLKYTTTNVAGSTIKFKVTDPTGKVQPAVSSAARTQLTLAGAADSIGMVAATNTVTVTDATAGGVTGLEAGDLVTFSTALTFDTGTDLVLAAANTAYEITAATATTFSFVSETADAVAAATDVTSGAMIADSNGTVKVLREKRGTDNSYVIDTGKITSATAADRTQTVVFTSADGASNTRSATVQGWTDDANLLNDLVDTSESLSAARTIQFVKVSEITAVTTLTAPKIGDTTLAAEVTTTPVINGAQRVNNTSAIGQSAAEDFIRVLFTRQDSATKWASDSAAQSTVDGVWSASASMAVGTADASWSSTTKKLTAAADWGFSAPEAADTTAIAVSTAGLVTVTNAGHGLRTGDKVTVVVHADDAAIEIAEETAARDVTVISSSQFTYSVSETTGLPTTALLDSAPVTGTEYTVATYASGVAYLVGRVFAGTHSAQALINTVDAATDTDEEYTATGTASTLGTLAAAAADIRFTTAGSANVQGSSNIADDATRDAYIKAGTLSVPVVATVVDVDGVAVGAGRSVAFTITRSAATIKVNDKTDTGSVITDANGQVTFTVTDTLGLAGSTVTIDATAEGVSTAVSDITLEWATQAFTLYDLATSEATLGAARTVAAGTSYDLNLLVADQWGAVPTTSDVYRLRVTGSGVTEGFVNFTAGKATVKVTDTKVATSIASTIALQMKNATTAVYADVDATPFVLTTTTTDKGGLTLGADATALYAGVTVDLADLVAAKALVERDTRTSFVAQPIYTNDVVVSGKATNSSTGANLANSVVRVSGSSAILFSNGAVEKRGSITLVADANGEFAVTLYSTTALTDSVVTVTANGVSKEVKVSFTGIGVGEGTALTVTAPARAAAASTFQVTAKLADVFGNGVEATTGRIKVTYTGPGIAFGALPTATDKNGELSFSILLGSADKGVVTATVQYDQNGDADFVDAKDLTATKTILVGVTGGETAAIAGSTNRFFVSVDGNSSARNVVVKVAGKTVATLKGSTAKKTYVVRSTKGSKKVTVYVGGKLIASKTVTVK